MSWKGQENMVLFYFCYPFPKPVQCSTPQNLPAYVISVREKKSEESIWLYYGHRHQDFPNWTWAARPLVVCSIEPAHPYFLAPWHWIYLSTENCNWTSHTWTLVLGLPTFGPRHQVHLPSDPAKSPEHETHELSYPKSLTRMTGKGVSLPCQSV